MREELKAVYNRGGVLRRELREAQAASASASSPSGGRQFGASEGRGLELAELHQREQEEEEGDDLGITMGLTDAAPRRTPLTIRGGGGSGGDEDENGDGDVVAVGWEEEDDELRASERRSSPPRAGPRRTLQLATPFSVGGQREEEEEEEGMGSGVGGGSAHVHFADTAGSSSIVGVLALQPRATPHPTRGIINRGGGGGVLWPPPLPLSRPRVRLGVEGACWLARRARVC